MRLSVAVAIVCLSTVGISLAGDVRAAIREPVDIPPQSLSAALQRLAKERDFQVAYTSEEISRATTQGASGELTIEEALTQLLKDTAFTYKIYGDNGVSIVPRALTPSAPAMPPAKPGEPTHGSSSVFSPAMDESAHRTSTASGAPKSLWQRLRLVMTEQTPPQDAGLSSSSEPMRVEEIVVTAQKRTERLQDVPVPVTPISADSLVRHNQLRIQDYYTRIPGLNLTVLGTGNPSISIRGLSTGGYSNPTVGTVIDDLPFGASSAAVNSILAFPPDLDPSELSRVEVLRGPQGTLYGASSLGGLLKFVTVDPSTDRLSGRVEAGTSSARHGSSLGYSARGAVNVPLSETFAIRASGSTRRDPGYVDNVQTGQNDVNRTDSRSARLAALWQPTDTFSLRLSALYQDTERDGSPEVALLPGLEGLEQNALINTGTNEQEIQAYSATMTWQLDRAELTSITGYSRNQLADSADQSPVYGACCAQALFGVSGAAQTAEREGSRFTQELRLSMPLASQVDWLLGGFYTDESYRVPSGFPAIDPANGAVAGNMLFGNQGGSYEEYAAFTNLTFKITPRFDVQLGGRQSHNSTSYEDNNGGPLYGLFGLPEPAPTAELRSSDDAFTYLVTPRFRISPDFMVYARLASGYRPGGPNTNVFARSMGAPLEYDHDETRNYELGLKGSALDAVLSFEVSLFHIDWDDIQLQVFDPANPAIAYTANGGAARSQGAEVSFEVNPLEGLTLSGWAAFTDAELTEIPGNSILTAQAGDRLPYSARQTAYFSLDQQFPLSASNATGFAGASFAYVGERKGRFLVGVPQGVFPSYTQLNLIVGARFESWTLTAFLNNATDERGVLSGGNDAAFSYLTTYIQPRTGGVSLSKEF